MSCFDDEKLIKYFDGAIKDPVEIERLKNHILECDSCFDKYFFLFQAQVREKEVFKTIETKLSIPDNLDFIVKLDLHKPIELAEIALLKEDVYIEKLDIIVRSGEQTYPGFKIQKKEYPDLYLFKENEPNWVLYLEDEVELLTILIEDKVHYKAAYKGLDLLLLPTAKKYTLIRENYSPFSFKLC